MKIKMIVIVIMVVTSNIFASAANTTSVNITNDIETIEVRVAMLGEIPIPWGSWKFVFPYILNDFHWTVGNKSYKMKVTEIFDEEIMNGDLNIDNYDVLLVPGGCVGDGESIVKGFPLLPKVIKWKNNIAKFVKDGGGYFSVCGGTCLMTESSKAPTSFIERQYDKSSLGLSCVKSYYKYVGASYLNPMYRIHPERLGAFLYVFGFRQGATTNEDSYYAANGVSVDIKISRDHPIFAGYLEETERVRWIGGPALVIPEKPDRQVNVIGSYPEEGISNNDSAQIYAWKYTGGPLGLIRGFMDSVKYLRSYNMLLEEREFLSYYTYKFAGDWEKTDKEIDLDYSNKPCWTAETYPNENEARIVLTGLHPESPVWWGGHIEEMDDTENNSLFDGFHQWINITPINETIENERTHTFWMVRRSVAWAAKVPDEDLPPIYGQSEVCDIKPYEQSQNIKIRSNTEIFNNEGVFDDPELETIVGKISVDLFYQYSFDNLTWSEWELYGTDLTDSDGWGWEFNSPNGSGYYQFYSIRHVEYENHTESEKSPPGPDASVFVEV